MRHRGSTLGISKNKIHIRRYIKITILFRWSHADLIKMAHVTAKGDPVKEAVLGACVHGIPAMQKKLEGNRNPEVTAIMDYMAKVQKLKSTKPSKANNDVWDPVEAVRLIEKHSFDMDIIPTEQLTEAAVWEVWWNFFLLAFSREFQIILLYHPLPGGTSQAPTQ